MVNRLKNIHFAMWPKKWKLGQKEKDNGVLLLISVDDRKMRIEAGYGLEGVLTDALCSRIIRNEIAPHFRKDDYDGGVTAGIDAIIKGIGGEYSADDTDEDSMADLSWKEKLLIGAFVFGILGIFTFVGLIAPGCGGWFLYAFLVPFYATFPTILLGVKGGLTLLGDLHDCISDFEVDAYERRPGVNGCRRRWEQAAAVAGSGPQDRAGLADGRQVEAVAEVDFPAVVAALAAVEAVDPGKDFIT